MTNNKTMLRFLALMLLLVATLANRGDKSCGPKQKPFRSQGWGLSNTDHSTKEKPVKEVKNVKDKKPANAAAGASTAKDTKPPRRTGMKKLSDEIDELMDGFE